MGRNKRVRRLAELLHQADEAYREYTQKVLQGDRDLGWPEWYADYLIGHGLDVLMDERLAVEVLAGFLLRSRVDHKACCTGLTWEEFAAARMEEKRL